MKKGRIILKDIRLTERLRADGHPVLSEPRITGDGYYESAVGDPDGNLVELVYKA